MMQGNMSAGHTSLETRPSLLRRLKTRDDPLSWEEFYDTYGGLIRHFAARAGLNEHEADEVVQETAIGVSRRLPEFLYDPKVCRFKTWLLNLVRWRIDRQLRRRQWSAKRTGDLSEGTTEKMERIPDPAVPEFGGEWDAEWERNLVRQALERLRQSVEESHYQAFDLLVMKEWSPKEVAQTLGMSTARIYLIKHRISIALKKEVRRLEKLGEERLRKRSRGTRAS